MFDGGAGGEVNDIAGQCSGIYIVRLCRGNNLVEQLTCRDAAGRAFLEELAKTTNVLGCFRVALVSLGHVAVGQVQDLQVLR